MAGALGYTFRLGPRVHVDRRAERALGEYEEPPWIVVDFGVHRESAPALRMIVEEGRPATVIKEAVRRLRPDVVLMGTGQRGALSRLFLGSVAEKVLSDAACDVLVVPPVGPEVPTPLGRDVE
jgi:nucleotide-binding universal stress UspA family protein